MSRRHEVRDADDIEVSVIDPGDDGAELWDDETPANGRHALIIGNPWAGAYAAVGTPDELGKFAARTMRAVSDAQNAPTTVEAYALDMVAHGAESLVEDDTNEDGEVTAAEHDEAVALAYRIIQMIVNNPGAVLNLARTEPVTD